MEVAAGEVAAAEEESSVEDSRRLSV